MTTFLDCCHPHKRSLTLQSTKPNGSQGLSQQNLHRTASVTAAGKDRVIGGH